MIVFRLRRFAFWVAVFALTLTAADVTDGQTLLRWKFDVGDRFDVELTQATSSKTSIDQYQIQQTYEYELATSWSVTGIDDQNRATIEKTVRSIKAKIESAAPVPMSINVDTAGDEPADAQSQTLLRHLKTLVGKTLLIRMSERGEVEQLPLPAETKRAIEAFPPTDYVLQMFHIESIAASETSYIVVLPDEALTSGNTWQQKSAANVAQNEAFVTEFAYNGQKETDGKQRDVFTTRTKPVKAGDREVNANENVVVTTQRGAGECHFDREQMNFAYGEYHNEVRSKSPAQNTDVQSDFKVIFERK